MRYTENSIEAASASHIMYIDMNSFFASCEQQDFPELRGKPIGVCTYNSPNACVIAPSIEAKRYGVKTGMRLGDCRALCPGIIPLTTRPHRYRWTRAPLGRRRPTSTQACAPPRPVT